MGSPKDDESALPALHPDSTSSQDDHRGSTLPSTAPSTPTSAHGQSAIALGKGGMRQGETSFVVVDLLRSLYVERIGAKESRIGKNCSSK